MTTIQKIEALQKVCEDSVGFQCYTMGWEVTSFRNGTPLSAEVKRRRVGGKTFVEAVNDAYQFVFESK